MTNDEIKESVDNYKQQLRMINLTVAKLQAHCRHKETEIKSVSQSVMQLKNFCKICSAELGYPTKEELKKAGYSQT